MIFSLISALVLAAVGFRMLTVSQYRITRRMAWIPLSMAVMELALCGALDMITYWPLTLILLACRATVLWCSWRALKQDVAMARNARRRRAVWRRIVATAPEALITEGATAGGARRTGHCA